jgi:hypothetical protein
MPFKKVGTDKYVSPSGRKFTGDQVKLYYATEGFTKKPALRPASPRPKSGGKRGK